MGETIPLQWAFERMWRDGSRERLPKDACWDIRDWLPGLDAPLVERGGWPYHSADIGLLHGATTAIMAGGWAPFEAGGLNCAIDEDGNLYTISDLGVITDHGLGVTPQAPLAFHRDKLIVTANDGTTAPRAFTGTSYVALGGSPPAGRYGLVFKDRTVLGNTAAEPQRWVFSGPGDPESWDTANSWIDDSYPVTGGAVLRNAFISFSQGQVQLFHGSIPPPAGDMFKGASYKPGCLDARSIVIVDDVCYYASDQGFHATDGTTLADMTELGGMTRYWRDLFDGYTDSWTIAAGEAKNWIAVAVMDGSTFKDGFLVHTKTRAFLRISNLPAVMFWSSIGAGAETFFGLKTAPRVGRLTPIFDKSASTMEDGNGAVVAGSIETGYYQVGHSKARIRDGYFTYDLRDPGGQSPTMTVSAIDSPEQTVYTAMGGPTGAAYALPATATMDRQRRSMRKAAFGVAFKLEREGRASDARLYRIDADARARESTRVG